MFDLYYFNLSQSSDSATVEPRGFYVAPPPKAGGRGREGDLLFIYLTFNTPTPYLPPAEKDLLSKIASVYYKSAGSVTSGMRQAAERLNALLLERNLREGGEGVQAFGMLALGVLRDDMLYLAQGGAVHSLVLSASGLADNFDESSKSGLGAGSTSSIRFYQSALQSGDVVVLCARPSVEWNAESLAGGAQMTLEHLRRRLLAGGSVDPAAVVVRFQTGKGQVHPLRLRPVSAPVATPPSQPAAEPVAQSMPSPVIQRPSESAPAAVKPAPSAAAPVKPVPQASKVNREAEAEAANARLAARRMAADQRRQKMATTYLGWKKFTERLGAGWRNLLSKVSPTQANQPVSLSAGSMLFIALVVPVLVVVVATTVYFQSGRAEQRQVYYQQAVAYTSQAQAQTDPVLKRNNWVQVLQWLDKTEQYGTTDETRALRLNAQKGIDGMDKVVRLDFLPVNQTGFAASVKITRVLANNSGDIFILDGNAGRVTRLNLVNQSYEIDPRFECGPGNTAPILIGPLVDIDLMPAGNPFNASLIAVDTHGSVVFCIQGKPSISAQLPAPAEGWGTPSRIRFTANTLNVIDLKRDDVYRFTATKDMIFDSAPRSFFKDKKTITLKDVTDMTVYNDDLFLLRADGKMTKCQDPKVKDVPVRCSDPVNYEDPRQGRSASPTVVADTVFIQLAVVETPNPSLYLLDRSAPAVYQFSMALYLNEQYRAQPYSSDLPKSGETLTAFTVTSNRRLFMAFGNRLYFAIIQ